MKLLKRRSAGRCVGSWRRRDQARPRSRRQAARCAPTEQEVDPIGLAPGHQIVPRKARVGAHQDAHPRPPTPNLRDDARHLLDRAVRRIQGGTPQLGEEQMAPAEHVEGQIAVAIVVAVEKSPLLLAVHRIIRRIEIENDLFGSPHMRLHEQVDQQRPDRHRIVTDLVVARRRKLAQLQPVERRLAGDRRAVLASRLELACQHRHQRIVAQLIVVVEYPRNRARSRTPAGRPASRPRARSAPGVARRESTPQTDPSFRSHDRSLPEATRQRPTSPSRHQTPLPQHGLQRFQNQTLLRYSPLCIGVLPNRLKWLLHNDFR